MIYTIKELPMLLIRELGEEGDIGRGLVVGIACSALLWAAIFGFIAAVTSC